MNLILSMLFAFSLTLALELFFALAWGLRRRQLWMVVLMNALTNPAANVLYSFMTVYLGWQKIFPTLFLELAVIAAEGLCCKDFMEKPWCFVILVNVFSYAAGLLLQAII